MKKIAALAWVLMMAPAQAQQQQKSPVEQVLTARVMQEIQTSLNCGVDLITMQAALDKANARVKELEGAKPEKPKD